MLKLLRRYLKEQSNAIIVGLSITAAIMALHLLAADNSAIIQRVNGLIYDLRLNANIQTRHTDANIIVVDIDERSLEQEGRFPWSRVKIAKLIKNLADAGAVVVAFDVMFPEPERNPVEQVVKLLQQQQLQLQQQQQQAQQADGQNPTNQHLTTLISQISPLIEQADADAIMTANLNLTDVVLGMAFQEDPNVKVGTLPVSQIVFDHPDTSNVHSHQFYGYTNNIEMLQDNAPGIGFINSSPDDDNFIRTTSLLAQYEQTFYPSLALEAAKLYTLADEIQVLTADFGHARSITGLKLGRKVIPTDEYGRVLIPFKGKAKSYPYVSATDVLQNTMVADMFDNAIVFVGTSAIGHADLRATPVGVQYPGVEIHANVIDGLLHPEIIPSQPDWADAAALLLILLVGLIMSLIMPTLGPLTTGLMGTFMVSAIIGLDFYLWSVSKISIPMATILLTAVTLSVSDIAIGYVKESGKRKQIKGIFDQYVPPAHIDKMLQNPDAINLSGERKEMTVLFSDIRSFTTISEKLTANELATLLNRYFSPITKSIFEHKGTIDKYVGDMVMAFWNAPLDDPDHVENAIMCAFQMLTITDALTAQFEQEGFPQIKVGVGINTGEMNVGDMGSEYRRAYTVLGDAVNLGSRLEGLTKFYGVDLLCSETSLPHCPNLSFRPIDKVRVKGKHESVSIYEPIHPDLAKQNDVQAELIDYIDAYQSYLDQQWPVAEEKFSQLVRNQPNRKVYSIYLDRIAILRDQTLAADWDGSFTHTSK